jgi:hypothetical protein
MTGAKADRLLLRPPCFFLGREALHGDAAVRADAAVFARNRPIVEKVSSILHAVKAPFAFFWSILMSADHARFYHGRFNVQLKKTRTPIEIIAEAPECPSN